MRVFGFEIKRQPEEQTTPETPIIPSIDDGAINIQTGVHYGLHVDIEGTYKNDAELITRYRNMAMQPEMENAIEDIINEAIVRAEDGTTVKIQLDELDQPDNIKKMIRDEFANVLKLLDFNNFGSDIFRRWYVDGRSFYNVNIDMQDPRAGIQSLVYIDPRRIRKIRAITKKKNAEGVEVVEKIESFYLYNEKASFQNQNPHIIPNFSGGVKLSEDSVIQLTSGLYDAGRNTVLSYLHKAIRPMNQLRFVEDATVIYRVSRAPERRVFYIDVGNMPKMKAEQYLKDMMTKFRNKLTYDAATGEVRDATKSMSMLEDFWMPRRGEGKGTEITTLPAGQNLGQMEDVLYFEKKLYRALNVPPSRLEPSQGFSLGRSSEITRDELKFDKFIGKLRSRFSILFDELLARQLTLKGVCTLEEWNEFKQSINYDFMKDNNFSELKESELLQNRLGVLALVDPYIGRYFSKRWAQENILRFNEEEIKDMEKEMDEEAEEMAKEAEANGAGQPGAIPGVPGQPGAAPTGGGLPQIPQTPEQLNAKVQQEL